MQAQSQKRKTAASHLSAASVTAICIASYLPRAMLYALGELAEVLDQIALGLSLIESITVEDDYGVCSNFLGFQSAESTTHWLIAKH